VHAHAAPHLAELGVLCADPHKRCLCTYIVSLGVILCHTLRGVYIPTAKVISASADLTGIHSGELVPSFNQVPQGKWVNMR
jgi:hypothetical protein